LVPGAALVLEAGSARARLAVSIYALSIAALFGKRRALSPRRLA